MARPLSFYTARMHRGFPLVLMLVLSSCSILRENPKYQFASGVYNSKAVGKDVCKAYVHHTEENIRVYAVRKSGDSSCIDSIRYQPMVFEPQEVTPVAGKYYFSVNSFDLDVLTIPFKYRPVAQGFPRQFTTQLNGGFYLGYRRDVYMLHYHRKLLGPANLKTHHFGFSFGGFTGFGSTSMNPWVTGDQITSEYEGVAWSKGIAAIAGINNFTAGIALGWDHLIDKNKTLWIYQGKPWVGLVFGLSLN
jgi:hypothetical protein